MFKVISYLLKLINCTANKCVSSEMFIQYLNVYCDGNLYNTKIDKI